MNGIAIRILSGCGVLESMCFIMPVDGLGEAVISQGGLKGVLVRIDPRASVHVVGELDPGPQEGNALASRTAVLRKPYGDLAR